MRAFHPAWHAAANRTATKTKLCTHRPYTGATAPTIGGKTFVCRTLPEAAVQSIGGFTEWWKEDLLTVNAI
jgi:hypothetical protein